MKPVLLVCMFAMGLAACGSSITTNSTNWSYNDGTAVKGQAALEQQFQAADEKCRGHDMTLYNDCMSARGYTEGAVLPNSTPTISAAPSIVRTPFDWRARAAEARTVASQIQDPRSKQMMIGIAETYDRLATYSEGETAVVRRPR